MHVLFGRLRLLIDAGEPPYHPVTSLRVSFGIPVGGLLPLPGMAVGLALSRGSAFADCFGLSECLPARP